MKLVSVSVERERERGTCMYHLQSCESLRVTNMHTHTHTHTHTHVKHPPAQSSRQSTTCAVYTAATMHDSLRHHSSTAHNDWQRNNKLRWRIQTIATNSQSWLTWYECWHYVMLHYILQYFITSFHERISYTLQTPQKVKNLKQVKMSAIHRIKRRTKLKWIRYDGRQDHWHYHGSYHHHHLFVCLWAWRLNKLCKNLYKSLEFTRSCKNK